MEQTECDDITLRDGINSILGDTYSFSPSPRV
jgi:hypothetical protein